jgi:hypothetical protein
MKKFFSYKKILFLVSVLIIVTIYMAMSVFALGASPMKVEYSGMPGETLKGQVSVYNPSDEAKYIYLNKSGFTYNDGSEEIVYTDTSEDSLKEWIIFPDEPVYIAPKQKTVVPYEIAIPEEAESKGYYGAIFIESGSVSDAVEDSSTISAKLSIRLAHLVLLEVEGSLFEDVSLKDIVVSQEHDDSFDLQLIMYNDGNVHGFPEGSVEFYNQNGALIHTMDVNPEKDEVMPKHKKTFTAPCPFSILPKGTYYVIFSGYTDEGKELNTKFMLEITENNEVFIREDDLSDFNIDNLRGTASQKTQMLQAGLGVLGIFVIALFLAYFLRCTILCLTNKKTCHFWWHSRKKTSKKGKKG